MDTIKELSQKELSQILSLIKKYDLPLSPILEYAVNEKIELSSTSNEKEDNENDSYCLKYDESPNLDIGDDVENEILVLLEDKTKLIKIIRKGFIACGKSDEWIQQFEKAFTHHSFDQVKPNKVQQTIVNKKRNSNNHNYDNIESPTLSKRVYDRSLYRYKDKIYIKRDLVAAVVKDIVIELNTTYYNILRFFSDCHPCGYPLIRRLSENPNKVRYNFKYGNILKSTDGVEFVVCNQFGLGQINKFLSWTNKMGIEITIYDGKE